MADWVPFVVAALLAGGLAAWAENSDLPEVTPSQAGAWEGHRVILTGSIIDIRPAGERLALDLADDHVVLPVLAPAGTYHLGGPASATGRLAGLDDGLLMFADNIQAPLATPATPSWAQVANAPTDWAGHLIRLDGHGDGTWLTSGPYRIMSNHQGPGPVHGVIWLEPSCLCYELRTSSSIDSAGGQAQQGGVASNG